MGGPRTTAHGDRRVRRHAIEGEALATFVGMVAAAGPRDQTNRVVAHSARNRFTGLVTLVGLTPGVPAVASVKSTTTVVVELPES
jgi:hypothetical protein